MAVPPREVQLKQALRQQLVNSVSQSGVALEASAPVREALLEHARQLCARLARGDRTLGAPEQARLAAEVVDDLVGYGPLQPLIDDPAVTEIMVNGPQRVFVERQGHKTQVPVQFDDELHLRTLIQKLLRPSGRRLDEAVPFVDLALPDGSRVNIVVPPAVLHGPHLTIRRFSGRLRTLAELVGLGTLDERMAHTLEACVASRHNVLISGPTGSGKTTLLEVLAGYIGDEERIVTIEDTPELTLRQPNVARLLTRPPNLEGRGEVTPQELFHNCLRMRPSRILLGELRGREAAEYLQALNSGHRGCLAVVHAATPAQALLRLEHLVLLAHGQVPLGAIRSQLVSGLQRIVQLDLLADGVRRITQLSEVLPPATPDGPPQTRDLFRWEAAASDAGVAGAGGGSYVEADTAPAG